MADRVRVAIVGSGFAGLGVAIRLHQQGMDDFVVFERAAALGGTWRDNTYPGCACDVPSHLYSFSFAPNPDWTHAFSGQQEIWDYLERCADEFGVRDKIRFNHDVEELVWDETSRTWSVTTSGGTWTADVVISGPGPLSEPLVPDLPGLASFEGTAFHSARWDHEHDLRGERVAVVGTGASAIQFVPKIQPDVKELHLFQRTPPWVIRRTDRPYLGVEKWLFRHVPGMRRFVRGRIYLSREFAWLGFAHPKFMWFLQRGAVAQLHRQVKDPALRERLRPTYRMGCKRVLISEDYYPSLAEPNVEVITEGVREIRARSIVAADGTEREVDTIIFGTGFHVTDFPFSQRVVGVGGRRMSDVFSPSAQAHHGTTVAGFPNYFQMTGPNTGLGHNSIVYMIESQVEYILDALRLMERTGVNRLEVRPAAQERFNAHVQREMENTVWTAGGCQSWYIDATGRNTSLWPGPTWEFRRLLAQFTPEDYELATA